MYTYNKTTLQFQKIKRKQYIWPLLGLALVFSSLGFTSAIKLNYVLEKIPVIVRLNQEPFSKEWLKNEIQSLNLDHPDIVLAQAEIETGNYTSQIFKQNKNLFGMKVAKSRPTTAVKEQLNHAYYNSYKESLLDYALWQANYAKNLTKQEYLQLLQQIYAEDANYVFKLKQKIN